MPLLSLQTGQEPRITTLRAVVVYRARGKKLVVVIGQKKALHAQDAEAALIVVKVTRSISPDISSVAGLRSESAAFTGRRPFCHGKRLASVPIRKLILRGFGCGVSFASGRESHRSTRALGPSRKRTVEPPGTGDSGCAPQFPPTTDEMELVQKTSFFGLAAGIGPWTLSFVTAHFRAQPSAFLNYDCAHRHDMA